MVVVMVVVVMVNADMPLHIDGHRNRCSFANLVVVCWYWCASMIAVTANVDMLLQVLEDVQYLFTCERMYFFR